MNRIFIMNIKSHISRLLLQALGVVAVVPLISLTAQAYEPCYPGEVLGAGYACKDGRIVRVDPDSAPEPEAEAAPATAVSCTAAAQQLTSTCSQMAESTTSEQARSSYAEMMMMQTMMGGGSDMLSTATMAFMGLRNGHGQVGNFISTCEPLVNACKEACAVAVDPAEQALMATCTSMEGSVNAARVQQQELGMAMASALQTVRSLIAQNQTQDQNPGAPKFNCKEEMASMNVPPEHIKMMCEGTYSGTNTTASTNETPKSSVSDATGLGITDDLDEFEGLGERPTGGNNQVEQLSAAGAGGGMMGSSDGGSGAAAGGKEKAYSMKGNAAGYNTDILRGLSSSSSGRQGARHGARTGARGPASAQMAGPRSGSVHPLALNQRGAKGTVSAFQPQGQEIRPRDSDSLFDRTHKVLYKEKYLMQGDFLN